MTRARSQQTTRQLPVPGSPQAGQEPSALVSYCLTSMHPRLVPLRERLMVLLQRDIGTVQRWLEFRSTALSLKVEGPVELSRLLDLAHGLLYRTVQLVGQHTVHTIVELHTARQRAQLEWRLLGAWWPDPHAIYPESIAANLRQTRSREIGIQPLPRE